MKHSRSLLAVSLLVLVLFLSGCVTPGSGTTPDENDGANTPVEMGWYAYSPVQAETNPWQLIDTHLVVAPTEEQRVQAWLAAIDVQANGLAFIPHDEPACDALNCPRGDLLVIDPANQASAKKLVDLGFTRHHEAFVYAASADAGTYSVVLVNAGTSALFFGGCNEFVPEKQNVDGTWDAMPAKVCVWEGIPTQLAAGQTTSFEWTPEANGTYRMALGYGISCTANEPLSQANCAGEGVLYTAPIPVGSVVLEGKLVMSYDIKQCNSNPWQVVGSGIDVPSDSASAFSQWVERNKLEAEQIKFVPAPEGTVVCASCACGTGARFEVVVDSSQQARAEELGFTFKEKFVETVTPLDYAAASWYVYTPYQCFANLWNSTEDPVRSVEKDIRKLEAYLNEQGVEVAYTTFIRGVSLSAQCTKKSTDRYGIGVLDDQSKAILKSLAFAAAGTQLTELFTSTSNVTPTRLLFRTKFCAAPPWGTPDLTTGNEAAVQARVTQWLAENGIAPLSEVTIHSVTVSATGSCDTDSGKGVLVNVPEWAAVHLGAKGFLKPSTLFNASKTQIYPATNGETDLGIVIGPAPDDSNALV